MSLGCSCLIAAILASFAFATSHASDAGHIPDMSACSAIWYGTNYDPPAPKSLNELPRPVREKLNSHLVERLGPELASRLTLAGGQIVDRDILKARVPESGNFKWRVPKYNLQFNVPVGDDPTGYCASVRLDEDGTILAPIGMPDLRAHPERAHIALPAEATRVARRAGVPIEKATRNLQYFRDTETLEYDFEFAKHDDGLVIVYSHFHVVAHDISNVHWTESEAIR